MLTFRIEKDGNKYHAFCPELKGCHTFGDTPKEALDNLKDAIELYLEDEIECQVIHSKDIPTGTAKAIIKDAGIKI